MMHTNALEQLQDILHGIQALRRNVERQASPYQGATGVRAQFYPHQLQTVLRVLRDTQVRHLIADEVGLGKTIQALMILNAIRLQRGGRLRTVVVVPREQHARQWADEVWQRVHTTAFVDDEQPTGDDWVHILWSAKLRSPVEMLDPTRCDLLILDELQSLRADVLSTVVKRARRYQHLLALTATPDLRSAQPLCQLMQLIEPDRVDLFNRRVTSNIAVTTPTEGGDVSTSDVDSDDVEDIAVDVQEQILLQLRNMRQESALTAAGQLDLAAMSSIQLDRLFDKAWWIFRRVVRSRRKDFPNHLPSRLQETRIIEPLAADQQRSELMRSFLAGLLQRENDRDRAALVARRAIVGGAALRDRIGELQRQGRDPHGELEEVKLLCRPECGNARLDELIDYLAKIWRDDPQQKVLIAAQDNPTIQFLEQQISLRMPEVGTRDKRVPLHIVALLSEQDNVEHSLVDAYLRAQRSIAPFESGDAQLAIAHEDYREAYNFQTADVLVFYNIPWTPDQVDQWIGRVDRLGRESIDPTRPHTRPVPVRILAIGLQGNVDHRMIEVYEASGVFDRPLQLDRDEALRIAEEIVEAGLGIQESNWETLQHELGSRSSQQEALALDQPVALGTPAAARDLYDQLRHQRPVEPVMRHANRLGYVCTDVECAFAQWLQVLRGQNYYRFVSNEDADHPEDRTRRFFTISQRGPRIVGLLDRIAKLESPQWAPFFLTRKHIQRPPRRFVQLRCEQRGEFRRTLEFLDHGSPLHEELVAKWIEAGSQAESRHGYKLWSFRLHLSSDALPEDSNVAMGRYFVAVGYADPASCIVDTALGAKLLAGLEGAQNQSQVEGRQRELRQMESDCQADARFVRSYIPTQLPIVGCTVGGEEITDKRLLYDLLTPVWTAENHPFCDRKNLKPEAAEKQLPKLMSWFAAHLNDQVEEAWREHLTSFSQAVRERLLLIDIESKDRILDLQAQLGAIEARIREFEQWPSERNNRIIQLTFRPKQSRVKELIQLSCRRRSLRKQSLSEALESVRNPVALVHQCLDLNIEQLVKVERNDRSTEDPEI